MLGRKNKDTARKVVVKNESPDEQEVKINRDGGKTVDLGKGDTLKVQLEGCSFKPLVTIEKHEHRVNGQAQRPTFRIGIAERDIITLSPREYDELFMEMLRHKDAGELIHDIAAVHMEEHEEELEMIGAFKGLEEAIEKAIKESH